MDQIVKNILKQQGFDHIGVFDKENNIWIYTKDGKVNFCRSDLSSIDRKTIGLEAELIVLTEAEDAVRVRAECFLVGEVSPPAYSLSYEESKHGYIEHRQHLYLF